MSIKSRIQKIERSLPEKDERPPKIIEWYYYGARPSQKERRVALEKEMERNPNSKALTLKFIPYGFEHIINPPRGIELTIDKKMGTIKTRNLIYKLVKNYDKKYT